MKYVLTFILGAVALLGAATLYVNSPVGQEAAEKPEQPHYVIALYVCGAPNLIIVTTSPPAILEPSDRVTPEVAKLLRETPKERVFTVIFRADWCPISS